MSGILSLQEWFAANCDGEWEHEHGITIDTIDNPGWRLRIDLQETSLIGMKFESVEVERSELDWIHCRVEKDAFVAFGGPRNLQEMVETFETWRLSKS